MQLTAYCPRDRNVIEHVQFEDKMSYIVGALPRHGREHYRYWRSQRD